MIKRLLLLLTLILTIQTQAQSAPRHLWLYHTCNFQVNASVDMLITNIHRAKAAGYNGIVITDFKFGRFADRPDHFYKNLKRVRAAADDTDLDLIPCVMPIGYSTSILTNDPNLAAGLPVKKALYEVQNNTANFSDATEFFPHGNFETWNRKGPLGWDWLDGYGVSITKDTQTKHAGNASLRMSNFKKDNSHGNCRLSKLLKVKPFHQYHLRLWVKTKNVNRIGDMRCTVLSKAGWSLSFQNLGVRATQDWKMHDVVFNSLDNDTIRFYVGIWGGDEGEIWIDDLSLQPDAAINLIRRDTCPIKVTSEDREITYEEGKDFEKWYSPHTGREPYAGSFKPYHQTPPIKITPNSRIKPGKLLVSYYHTQLIHDAQVGCVLRDEALFKYLEQQIHDVHKHLRPKTYFMQHDEIRVAGWDLATRPNETAGMVLAQNVKRCREIIKSINPAASIIVWSDMFDPHHNARNNYYLVKTTLEGSWEGLHPDTMIANWNGGKAQQSLRFFNGRKHSQIIAGYYDNSNVAAGVTRWLGAAKGVSRVEGIMYTTWRGDYSNLEKFAAEVKKQWGK